MCSTSDSGDAEKARVDSDLWKQAVAELAKRTHGIFFLHVSVRLYWIKEITFFTLVWLWQYNFVSQLTADFICV